MFNKIQILMMNNHINKADLAKAISVSSGNLSDWANGRSSPSIEKLIRIADYFDVSLDYLCGREDRYPEPTPDAFELLRIYDGLDKQGKTIVLASAYQQKQRLEGETK